MILREEIPSKTTTKSSYGSVTNSAAEKNARNLGLGGLVCAPTLGLQILRLQIEIVRFLVNCCEAILHDIQPALLCSSTYPIAPDVPKLVTVDKLSNNFASAARVGPYCSRANLDTARMRHLTATLLEIAKYHAWALREDPKYFAENFMAYKAHQMENITDTKGGLCATLGTRSFVSRSLSKILKRTYWTLLVWDKIHEMTFRLETLHDSISNGYDQATFREYFDTVAFLYFLLRTERDLLGTQIQALAFASPELRHMIRRAEFERWGDYELEANPPESPMEHFVTWILQRFGEEGTENCLVRRRLDYLDTSVRRSPRAKKLISPLIQQKLSCLFMFVECLQQLRVASIHATLTPRFDWLDTHIQKEYTTTPFANSIMKWFGAKYDHMDKVIAPHLGNPEDGKFDYPDEDTNSAEIVNTRRRAEDNLDKFWIHVDNGLRRLAGFSLHPRVRKYLHEGGSMRRTAPWQGPPDTQVTRDTVNYEYRPLSEVFHDPTKDITGNFNKFSIASKAKEKTKGMTTLIEAERGEDTARVLYDAPDQVFRVDRVTHMVMKTFFHSTNNGELPCNFRWADVVTALTKLGFSAEKLHGSVWHFAPGRLKLARGLHLHEPHPNDEVPLWLAQRYGRRLNRAYGWDGSMFKRK